jgi:tripartite-type tricarboxylate transporter receptor subunit TctC
MTRGLGRRGWGAAALGTMMWRGAAPAAAQAVADPPVPVGRQVTMVVSFPPAGATDMLARLVAARLGELLGQRIVVENRPGAAGTVGAAWVARAEADGTMLLVGADPELTLMHHLVRLPYAASDLRPLTIATQTPFLLAVHASRPERSFADLVTAARRGEVSVASPAARSPVSIGIAQLNQQLGTRFDEVPYRGGAAAAQDLGAGQVGVGIAGGQSLAALVQQGLVRVLVVLQESRSPLAPETPSLGEAGVTGVNIVAFNHFAVSARTQPEIAARWSAVIRRVLAEPEMIARLRAGGMDPVALAPEAAASYITTRDAAIGAAVRQLGWEREGGG